MEHPSIPNQIYSAAVNLFEGDQEAAEAWLKAPAPSLGGQKPIDLLNTEEGKRQVLDLINRIEYGVYT